MANKVSVIVPVYKVENYLRGCVDSVLSQTYKNFELLLVDDGSPDNSPAICDEYAAQDERIKVIHKKNGGQAEARNLALSKMTGDWVLFVDSDDRIDFTMIDKLLNCCLNNGYDIARTNCKRCSIQGEEIRPLPVREAFLTQEKSLEYLMKDILGSQPWFGIYRAELWEGVHFPKGRIYEDIAALYIVYYQCKTPVGIVDEPLYIYNLHDDSTSFSVTPNKNYDRYLAFRERWEFAVKHKLPYEDYCLYLASKTALGTINYYLRYTEKQIDKDKLYSVFEFLDTNRQRIKKNINNEFYYVILFGLYFVDKSVYMKLMTVLCEITKK